MFASAIGLLERACLAAALLAWACVASAQAPGDQVAAVTSALRARDFNGAVELSRSALKKFPNDAQLWTLQGIALASTGDNERALASFRQALKISPSYVAALQGAAQIEYQAGSKEAVPLLRHLLQVRPEDTTAHAMLAVMEFREGKCEGAATHFAKAGALIDGQLDALHAYGVCLVRLRQLEKASEVFQKAVALHPEDRQERHLLASIQMMAHKPEEAIATLGPLLENSSPDAATLELASSAYEDAKDTPHAVSTLRQAILLEPRNVDLYLDFANISFSHESFQVGIDVITDGLKLQPQAAQLYLARGVLYVQLAEYDKAEADFEKAQELDPSESLSSAAQGLAEIQQNDFDRALAMVQSKLAARPDDALLLYLQADILTQKGADPGTPEFELAMKSAKRAVSLQPRLGSAHGVLAKLYLQAGQNQAAVDECRKALALDPKDQAALYRLIQALRKIGKKEEIPELLKRLAQLREQQTKDERERYRYKLIEEDTPAKQLAQP